MGVGGAVFKVISVFLSDGVQRVLFVGVSSKDARVDPGFTQDRVLVFAVFTVIK